MPNEYVEHLVKLAQGRLDRGVINEPRVYFDRMLLTIANSQGQEVVSRGDIFRNGEEFPVQITHMVASTAYFEQDNTTVDAIIDLNSIGVRLLMRDHFYMNEQPYGTSASPQPRNLLPLAMWANTPTANNDVKTNGAATWRFALPFVLSPRDSISVDVVLEDNPAAAAEGNIQVTVGFIGHGMQSHRPYTISSRIFLADETRQSMSSDDFRNDGAEPIVIEAVNGFVSAGYNTAEVTGDARRLALNIRQVGSGTNEDWFVGPVGPATALMPLSLMGASVGRALVHTFPVPLIWQPGEGLDVAAQALFSGIDSYLDIAFVGHIMVT